MSLGGQADNEVLRDSPDRDDVALEENRALCLEQAVVDLDAVARQVLRGARQVVWYISQQASAARAHMKGRTSTQMSVRFSSVFVLRAYTQPDHNCAVSLLAIDTGG